MEKIKYNDGGADQTFVFLVKTIEVSSSLSPLVCLFLSLPSEL